MRRLFPVATQVPAGSVSEQQFVSPSKWQSPEQQTTRKQANRGKARAVCRGGRGSAVK